MNIGFLILRKTYYKQLATLIDEAIKNGHTVICIHNLSEPLNSPKAYDRPDTASIPTFRHGVPELAEIGDLLELEEFISKSKLEVLVTLGFTKEFAALRKKLTSLASFRIWAVIQHAIDDLIDPLPLLGADAVFLYTEKWKQWLLSLFQHKGGSPADAQRLEKHIRCFGAPQLDQYGDINPEKVRAQWGIPEGKKVVILLPFAFTSSQDRFWSRRVYGQNRSFLGIMSALFTARPRWIYQAWKGFNDQNVISAVHAFCKKNNAWLLIKSRKKDLIRPYALAAADQSIYDEEFYPATIYKCFAIADLCIHFNSTAVIEAAAAGVPSLNILPEARDYQDLRSPLLGHVYRTLYDLLNFQGVSHSLSIPSAIQELPSYSLDRFRTDPEQYQRFDKEYIGSGDRQATARILHSLEQDISSLKPNSASTGQNKGRIEEIT